MDIEATESAVRDCLSEFADFPVLLDHEASINGDGGRTWLLTRDSRLPDNFWRHDVVHCRGFRVFCPDAAANPFEGLICA